MAEASLKTQATDTKDRVASTGRRLRQARWWCSAGQPLLLLAADTLFLSGAIALAYWLGPSWAEFLGVQTAPLPHQPWLFIGYGVVLLALLTPTGLYGSNRPGSLVGDSRRIVGVASFVAMLLGFAALPLAGSQYGVVHAALLWINSTVFLLLARLVAYRVVEVFRRRGLWAKRMVIVGDSHSVGYTLQKLREKVGEYQIVGLVDLGDGLRNGAGDIPYLGSISDLPLVLSAHRPCEVLIAANALNEPEQVETLRPLIPPRTTVNLALDHLMGGVTLQGVGTLAGTLPTVRIRTERFPWHYETLKRLLDVALGGLALVALSPLMLLIALAIKLESSGPVLFRQVRIGRAGQPFTMYKFRSMRQDAEALLQELVQQNEAAGPMFKMREDPRITRVGKIIRRLSLDELPQFFNILEGTMSLVGPRPPLPNEVDQYQPWHFRRLEAVPGATGLWQVSRGPEISFDEMVQLDLAYIDHWSLTLDFKILLKTVPAMITARGAY